MTIKEKCKVTTSLSFQIEIEQPFVYSSKIEGIGLSLPNREHKRSEEYYISSLKHISSNYKFEYKSKVNALIDKIIKLNIPNEFLKLVELKNEYIKNKILKNYLVDFRTGKVYSPNGKKAIAFKGNGNYTKLSEPINFLLNEILENKKEENIKAESGVKFDYCESELVPNFEDFPIKEKEGVLTRIKSRFVLF